MSRMPLRLPNLNPEHHDGHVYFAPGTCTSGAIIGDNCKAADCPEHGLFPRRHPQQLDEGFRRLERQTKMRDWRDSRGERVRRWPDAVRVGTAAILLHPDDAQQNYWPRVLVHQRADNGYWGFPGGTLEVGETLLSCLVREAQEETGYIVEPLRLICVDSDPSQHAILQYPDGNVIHGCNLTFTCRILGGIETCSDESIELRWVAPERLPEPFLPAHLWRLQQALAHSMTVTVR
jgi:8-oxo-dGTP pyrophosphatase MutT (NUDIX family)